jgi:Tfp pilus assembly protein PilO
MRRLPPAKRNQLIVVLLITAALIGMVYFLLILPQNEENRRLASNTGAEQAELQKIKAIIKQRDATDAALREISDELTRAEEDVATGDVYAWTYDTLRRFKSTIEIPSITQPIISDEDMLANFPYKQLRVTLVGTAFYHDLGKFVADFENKFPHMRVVNLSIEPASAGANGPTEKLNFRLDVIALVRPNS